MLTGDEQTDRKTLLLSENYYIQNELLIKLHLPRGYRTATSSLLDRRRDAPPPNTPVRLLLP